MKPREYQLPELAPWSSLQNPAARAFSGTAVYQTEMEMPQLSPSTRAILDLGQVENIAEIVINGQPAATLWAPPFRIDITDLLKAGPNRIEIKVTNTWHNRLSYDQSLAQNERKTWTLNGPPKEDSIRLAGIIGPAVVRIAQVTEISPKSN